MVIRDILRRKRRVVFAVIGVLIGTMAVVGIFAIARAREARLKAVMDRCMKKEH